MKSRVAVITGSGRGIGAELAYFCAAAGYSVAINYRENESAAQETFGRVRGLGHPCHITRADVRFEADVDRLFTETVNRLGGVDVLVNNAHTPFIPTRFENLSYRDLAEQYDGTVGAAFLCIKRAIPLLRKSLSPVILNMSSATVVRPQVGFLHRDVAKAGLDMLTRSLAGELAPLGIRVNALSIGWTRTDQLGCVDETLVDEKRREIPLNRFAERREIAEAAMFLISPTSSYMTGAILPVDGGFGTSCGLLNGGNK